MKKRLPHNRMMMEITPLQYGLSILQFSLYGYLLVCGWRSSSLRKGFPIFYCYVALHLVTGIGRWSVIAMAGLDSAFYGRFYHSSLLGGHVFQIALLASIYFQVKHRRDREHWLLLVLFSVLIGWLLVSNRAQFPAPERLVEVMAILFQFLFALLVLVQVHWNDRLQLGLNHRGLLFGLVLSIALDIGLFATYSVGLFDYQSVRPWIQPLSILPWFVWAACMHSYSPSRRLAAPQSDPLRDQQQTFIRTVRELLRRS